MFFLKVCFDLKVLSADDTSACALFLIFQSFSYLKWKEKCVKNVKEFDFTNKKLEFPTNNVQKLVKYSHFPPTSAVCGPARVRQKSNPATTLDCSLIYVKNKCTSGIVSASSERLVLTSGRAFFRQLSAR